MTDTVFDLPAPVIARTARCLDTILLMSTSTETSSCVMRFPSSAVLPTWNISFKIFESATFISVPGGAGVLGILGRY